MIRATLLLIAGVLAAIAVFNRQEVVDVTVALLTGPPAGGCSADDPYRQPEWARPGVIAGGGAVEPSVGGGGNAEACGTAACCAEAAEGGCCESLSRAAMLGRLAGGASVAQPPGSSEFVSLETREPGAGPTQPRDPETVDLARARLFDGIPGDGPATHGESGTSGGPVTLDEIEAWLAEPANHRTLDPRLPIGLAAGALDRQGLKANPLTRAKIELGRQLFFDPRLSVDGQVSCATCHDPDHGYAEPRTVSRGVHDQQGSRNAPTVVNRLLSAEQFWDGRAASLEAQAIGPMANPIEMGMTHEGVVGFLRASAGYRRQFERLFGDASRGGEPVTMGNVGRAIACFERALVTGTTPWDHHRRLAEFEAANADDLAAIADLAPAELDEEDASLMASHAALRGAAERAAFSAAAERGAELFFGDRTGCTLCHAGAGFSDARYHNLGVGMEGVAGADDPAIDWGRFAVTGDDADRGAFKTPTLRNIAQTAPYMHDGSQATLEDVVAWYVAGGHANPWLSDLVEPLDLDEREQADLVAFLESLTGELPAVERGRLPE